MAVTKAKMKVCSVAWVKEEPFGVEFALVKLVPGQLSAVGVAIGAEPMPYRLDYRLRTRRGFVTSRLHISTQGHGWRRSLDLRRAVDGGWTTVAESEGAPELPPPGGQGEPLVGALDCDLGLSPLTNSMPVLRHSLLMGGSTELKVAWISVPDLAVRPSNQRYTFVSSSEDHHVVRYEDADFAADITFDHDGLVLVYPQLAQRLT